MENYDARYGPRTKPPGETGIRGYITRHPMTTMILVMVPLLLLLQWPSISRSFNQKSGIALETGTIAWQTNLPAALAEASRTNKKVLMDFTATWCPPCQRMESDTWPDAEVGKQIAASYIPVRLDGDAPASQPIMQSYQINAFPTVMIVDGHGVASASAHFLERDEMLEFLQRGLHTQPPSDK